ncbi:thiamine phosphate synthase [Halomonas piscis]|uniref:Thiamine-phosphate synthase n=1 Tax=Halomonas piscis TaxID=3031727 RepID=A0ABY9Z0K1_9GAMM|nr:thiamine phosphate synthase [Halomonas piscis]WNK20557.1 thiamine phosphate synthase [Halomonas piscis]
MEFDLSVYLVTDTDLCSEAGVEHTVEEAVAGGATIVQLRDKLASDEAMIELARRLKDALDDHAELTGRYVPLIINDRLNVALESGADGLHVGQSDTAVRDAREAMGEEAIIGLSIHNAEQLTKAPLELLDYVGFGPVFATQSKADHSAPIGFEGLAALVEACPMPGVAIGGVKAEHAEAVKQSGARGMAVVSAICGQPSPREAAQALAQRWQAAPKAP